MVDASQVLGTRDRSWGIRPVGEPEGGAPGGPAQFFWLWAPLHFDDLCTHFDVIEDGVGRVENSNGSIVPILADPSDEVIDYGGGIATGMESVSHRIRWRAGTRSSVISRNSTNLHRRRSRRIPSGVNGFFSTHFSVDSLKIWTSRWGKGMEIPSASNRSLTLRVTSQ